MSHAQNSKSPVARGFMSRLARDVRANTMMIMAMALIPLAGMVGGGVDISRLYIVKTRLQHACDAGALAGRKSMGGGTWSQSNYAPRTAAENFFDANYQADAYGATDRQRSFSENAGKVTGTVSAVLPMTLMKIFGRSSETLSVTCDAEMRLPNTDVMFVLDVTGSMAEAQPGDTVSKMDALKVAVKCFYEIVARLDTDATCTTGAPSGGTGNQVQIRFGFVPYDQNVNVGRLLPPDWFADSWNYQTRKANYTTSQSGTTWVQQGTPTSNTGSTQSLSGVASSLCNDATAASAGYNTSTDSLSNNGNTKTNTSVVTHITNWTSSSGGTCFYKQTTTVTTYTKQSGTTTTFKDWDYGQLPVTVSLLKNGTGWNDSFQWPVGTSGANKTITWDGCIEERSTKSYNDYDPLPSDVLDLDIDSTPTSDVKTKWGMALPGLTFTRGATATNSTAGWNRSAITGTTWDYPNASNYSCPLAAKKLQAWTDASAFDSYVDQLAPGGNTYHDLGLTWGARLMSPTGLFKSENQYTPQGGEIERHMIFMTDGDACTDLENYTGHGVDWYNPVTLPTGTTPSEGCTSTGNLTQQVNLRTEALCTAIKNKNITLWVIAFGDLASSTETRLQNCATPGRYFKVTSAAGIQQTFKSIADQISALRLTK